MRWPISGDAVTLKADKAAAALSHSSTIPGALSHSAKPQNRIAISTSYTLLRTAVDMGSTTKRDANLSIGLSMVPVITFKWLRVSDTLESVHIDASM
jgi:hypothetical protein